MVKDVTGAGVVSVHHDISTQTGEEIIVFTLTEAPLFRELATEGCIQTLSFQLTHAARLSYETMWKREIDSLASRCRVDSTSPYRVTRERATLLEQPEAGKQSRGDGGGY